jgi:hypothetical protein
MAFQDGAEETFFSIHRPFKCTIPGMCFLLNPQEVTLFDADGEATARVVRISHPPHSASLIAHTRLTLSFLSYQRGRPEQRHAVVTRGGHDGGHENLRLRDWYAFLAFPYNTCCISHTISRHCLPIQD